jgi:hypothetical protein
MRGEQTGGEQASSYETEAHITSRGGACRSPVIIAKLIRHWNDLRTLPPCSGLKSRAEADPLASPKVTPIPEHGHEFPCGIPQ